MKVAVQDIRQVTDIRSQGPSRSVARETGLTTSPLKRKPRPKDGAFAGDRLVANVLVLSVANLIRTGEEIAR